MDGQQNGDATQPKIACVNMCMLSVHSIRGHDRISDILESKLN